MIRLSVKNEHDFVFHITYVYRKNKEERATLWEDFRKVALLVNTQCWIAMGDFNEMLYAEDHIDQGPMDDKPTKFMATWTNKSTS